MGALPLDNSLGQSLKALVPPRVPRDTQAKEGVASSDAPTQT